MKEFYKFPNKYKAFNPKSHQPLDNIVSHIYRQFTDMPPEFLNLSKIRKAKKTPIVLNGNKIPWRWEINCFTITETDEFFLDYFPKDDHAQILMGWNTNSDFYNGITFENEPDLIIAKIYEFDAIADQADHVAFAHEKLLNQKGLEQFKEQVFRSVMQNSNSLDNLIDFPMCLLGMHEIINTWATDEFEMIENQVGEEELDKMSVIEINSLIAKNRSQNFKN